MEQGKASLARLGMPAPSARKVRRPGVADAVAGVAGTAGIGGSAAALMADWPWWVAAPITVIGVLTALLATGGRTAELWRRIIQIDIGIEGDRAVLAEIQRISAKLDDQGMPRNERLLVEERQQLIDELVVLRGLLSE